MLTREKSQLRNTQRKLPFQKGREANFSLASKKSTKIKEIATTDFQILDNGKTRSVKLSNTSCLPNLKSNLLSIGKIVEPAKVTFQSDFNKIFTTVVARGPSDQLKTLATQLKRLCMNALIYG
ncbi:hypothetical protein T4E_8528 [Trichinella pseudospiralis]|uniref:Uncharacterized protein n=1 Tax=Trichinella pseudospiralis TaxID=6337 RepID=A0A0V0XAX7_TRIPS|nr:hypothetical protein T4E_8528 [Trichinella pseudospiralis]